MPISNSIYIEQVGLFWIRKVQEFSDPDPSMILERYFEVVNGLGGLVTPEKFLSMDTAKEWATNNQDSLR